MLHNKKMKHVILFHKKTKKLYVITKFYMEPSLSKMIARYSHGLNINTNLDVKNPNTFNKSNTNNINNI